MSGIGSVLPGEPVPFEEINQYLGNFQNAPAKLMKWVERMQPVIHEMLGIEYCHYAFDKESREFTDDNLTLSVKAAQKAMKDGGNQAGRRGAFDLRGRVFLSDSSNFHQNSGRTGN